MFTHVMVGTNDPGKAKVFYDAVFGALGLPGMQAPNGALWYGDPEAREAMFAVVTPRNEEPACFANGGSDEGPPGPRDWGMPLYVAYLRDPDGNKLCGLYLSGEPETS